MVRIALGLVAVVAAVSLWVAGGMADGSLPDEEPLSPAEEQSIITQDVDGMVSTYAYQAEAPGAGCVGISHPVGLPLVPGVLGSCGGGFIPFVPWENARGVLSHLDEDTHTVIIEMAWEADEPLGEHLRLVSLCSEADHTAHPCYHEVPGMTSPLTIRIDRADAEAHGYDMDQTWTWHVLPGWGMLGTHDTLGVDVGLAYQQEYTLYFTYFQGAPAPDEYSRLP